MEILTFVLQIVGLGAAFLTLVWALWVGAGIVADIDRERIDGERRFKGDLPKERNL